MTDRLARWISISFDSSFLSLPIFLAFGYASARTPGLLWAILTLLIVTGIPLAYLILGIQRGWVSDMELTKPRGTPALHPGQPEQRYFGFASSVFI